MFIVFKIIVFVYLVKVMVQVVFVLCEYVQKQCYRVMSIMVIMVDIVFKDKNFRKQ